MMQVVADGRFAPSPTGDLHLGNLRTALTAWLFARSSGGRFVLRFDDLDQGPVRPEYYESQRRDLGRLGLDWDAEHRQTDHPERYRDAIDQLVDAGVTFPCWCTRRDIQSSTMAPHADDLPEGAYPGTCRYGSGRSGSGPDRRGAAEGGRGGGQRPAALRLWSAGQRVDFNDVLAGPRSGRIDDMVLRRWDGTPAYNLAVVVDDAAEGIGLVVRGDDLIASTPRQIHLARLLGLASPSYAHVPLVLAPDGSRLAKRHGAVTLHARLAAGESVAAVRGRLAASIGLVEDSEQPSIDDLLAGFDPDRLRQDPWILDPADPLCDQGTVR
jgi:glutamyl-tRNA synthetase